MTHHRKNGVSYILPLVTIVGALLYVLWFVDAIYPGDRILLGPFVVGDVEIWNTDREVLTIHGVSRGGAINTCAESVIWNEDDTTDTYCYWKGVDISDEGIAQSETRVPPPFAYIHDPRDLAVR